MDHGKVFTIAPGANFLRTLARALADGSLVSGFRLDPDNPFNLADVRIYLPTRRAARALRSEFIDLMPGKSAILPVIRPLGEIDDDAGYFDDLRDSDLSLLPAVSNTVRLLELSRIILAWRNRLPSMLRDIHSDSPLVAPASPADAIWLARNLTELIDAIETEEIGWDGLDRIELGDRALWWQLTGEFLKIARSYWPERLEELNRTSQVRHQSEILKAEARRYRRENTPHPVIVAGSTGSIPATAELIAAIHELECGRIVLPGLDKHMSDEDWALAGAMGSDGAKFLDPGSRSHPQYGLFHLLAKLHVRRTDVCSLDSIPSDLGLRGRALSRAFSPAESVVNHLEWRRDTGLEKLKDAFSDLALIEAANEREEALTLAIAIRHALNEAGEDTSRQVALVTPDRNLARRVASELRRFGLEADDSGGRPLAGSHQGGFVRLVLECVLRPGDPVALLSLLKHPLFLVGRKRDDVQRIVGHLEMLALRGGNSSPDIGSLSSLVTSSMALFKENKFRKQWQKGLDDPQVVASISKLSEDIENAVRPLYDMLVHFSGDRISGEIPLQRWAEATGQVLEALCVDEHESLESLWSSEEGVSLASLLREIIESDQLLSCTASQWIDVATALIAGISVKPKTIEHPRVMIWGTLEARLQTIDTLVLGGLNEGTWPGQTANNPFLSRAMKTEVGLEPPERRIGQSAHDFMMTMGNRKVILSRSLRQEGSPSVASRFVQRLLSVTGEELAATMRSRGQFYIDLAQRIDIGEDQSFAKRPEPKPAFSLQPKRYSFSEAGRLRRDPYSIYARRILKLDPLDPLNSEPGPLERGNLYHSIVEQFIRDGLDPRSPRAYEQIRDIANHHFDKAGLPPHVDAIWRPRFLDTAREFLVFESGRISEIDRIHVEIDGRLELPGLIVSGRADRIDIRKDGKADIIDYKTGLNPSVKEARSLLEPQLSLEAAVLKGGAFHDLKKFETENLIYVRLRPGRNFRIDTVNNDKAERTRPEEKRTADDLANEAIMQLSRLVAALADGQAGFKSRVAPFKDRDYGGDYDHLARVAEWSSTDGEEDSGDE